MAELNFNTSTPSAEFEAVIKVIGVGGGGCNAINNMIETGLKGVEFISANTDAKVLNLNKAEKRIQLGARLTGGLGAGLDPEIGRKAAEESHEMLAQSLEGADMLFIATGMGGGTGTGATPIIAEVAKKMGILTVAVVTRPFEHEGVKRGQIAQKGIDALKEQVDSLIVIPNEKLLYVLGEDIGFDEAFRAADNVLNSAVTGIVDLITRPGLISLDFADVRKVMSINGVAMMGSSEASGEDRARRACEQAIASPFLDDISLDGARGILANITTAPKCLKMSEYKEVMSIINQSVDESAEVKFGVAYDETMDEGTIRVTLVATGLRDRNSEMRSHHGRSFFSSSTSNDVENFDLSSVVHGSRGSRNIRRGGRTTLTAEDFRNQEVLDEFENPAHYRRDID